MINQSRLRKHADLLDRAALRLGVDLQDKVLDGEICLAEISDAVLRCMRCANPEDCAHWLARSEIIASAAPVYCRNREMMTGLRQPPQIEGI